MESVEMRGDRNFHYTDYTAQSGLFMLDFTIYIDMTYHGSSCWICAMDSSPAWRARKNRNAHVTTKELANSRSKPKRSSLFDATVVSHQGAS